MARAILLALALLLARATGAGADPVHIRYGWIGVPADTTPFMTATGAPRHAGKSYVAEPVHFNAATPMITALAAGEIDAALLGYSSLAVAVENAGLSDLRIFVDIARDGVPGYASVQYMVLNDGPIKSVADLKGRSVATLAPGGVVEIPIRIMLRRFGLAAGRDVAELEVATTNMVPMLLAGKADLASMIVPFNYDPAIVAKAHTLFSARDAMGPAEWAFYVARKEFLDKNRAAVADYVEDYLRSLHWLYDPANRAAMLKIVSDFIKLPPERFEGWLFEGGKDMYRDPAARVDVAVLQKNLDAYWDAGFAKARLEAAPLVDMSFVDAANRRIQPH